MEVLKKNIHQFVFTLLSFPRAWRFIRRHKLWLGLREYRWVFRFLLFVATLAGLYLLSGYMDWADEHSGEGVSAMFIGGDSYLSTISSDTYSSLTGGSLKWVILILLEVVIYHVMRKTMHLTLGTDMPDAHTFKPFLNAQIRMIKVSVVAYILEIILVEVVGEILGMIDLFGLILPIFILLVQSLLLGFAIVDNFNEQFKLTINQSLRYARLNYMGVCIGLGLPLFIILKIPFFGTIIGPILASVAAAIVMKEISDLHTVGYIPSKEEQKKIDKEHAKQAKRAAKAERKAARRRKRSGESEVPSDSDLWI